MVKIEYRTQVLVVNRKWTGVYITYFAMLALFGTLIFLANRLNLISPEVIIESWSLATLVIAIMLTILDRRQIPKDSNMATSERDTRSLLATDFLVNYGLMQLIYSFGVNFTSSEEMLKYRLLMFLSIPTNVIMQILSTSGLTYVFQEAKSHKKNLLFFDLIACTPVIVLVIIFGTQKADTLARHFGEIWSDIPRLLPAFLAMSLSAILLTHSSMIIRWGNLTRLVFSKRIVLSFIQVPVTLFAMKQMGALGILLSLLAFNILFITVNLHLQFTQKHRVA
jgi:hypothetical protein